LVRKASSGEDLVVAATAAAACIVVVVVVVIVVAVVIVVVVVDGDGGGVAVVIVVLAAVVQVVAGYRRRHRRSNLAPTGSYPLALALASPLLVPSSAVPMESEVGKAASPPRVLLWPSRSRWSPPPILPALAGTADAGAAAREAIPAPTAARE
jgi:hypothetical protein